MLQGTTLRTAKASLRVDAVEKLQPTYCGGIILIVISHVSWVD